MKWARAPTIRHLTYKKRNPKLWIHMEIMFRFFSPFFFFLFFSCVFVLLFSKQSYPFFTHLHVSTLSTLCALPTLPNYIFMIHDMFFFFFSFFVFRFPSGSLFHSEKDPFSKLHAFYLFKIRTFSEIHKWMLEKSKHQIN